MLYTVGGFSLPFYVLGGTSLLLSGVIFLFFEHYFGDTGIQKVDDRNDLLVDTKKNIIPKKEFFLVSSPDLRLIDGFTSHLTVSNLQRFPIVMAFFDQFLVCLAFGFLESMLEEHLSSGPMKATPSEVGHVFLVNGAVYTIASLVVGWV